VITASPTVAHQRASTQLSTNGKALGVEFGLPDVEFVFGRDGSLTARDFAGQWFSGSSLPGKVAEQLLDKLSIRGQTACMLAPTHPAQIARALTKLEQAQALIAVLPDQYSASLFLACEDFERDLRCGRLHLIFGEDWSRQLEQLLIRNEGLPVPTQFLRLPVSDGAIVDGMIPAAQQVFSRVTARRNGEIETLRSRAPGRSGATLRICVIAPSRQRMFDNATSHLLAALQEAGDAPVDVRVFDPDTPGMNSTLHFARGAADRDVIVAADLARSDLPNLVALRIPWITWVTGARIPNPTLDAAGDRLILCDPACSARAATIGWQPEQLAVFSDTSLIEVPETVAEYSSQELMWDAIAAEIERDPLAVYGRADALLASMATRFQIPLASIDAPLWVERLILPAYQHSLARLLIRSNLPIKLYGRNWDKIADLREHACGDLPTLAVFTDALAACSGIVHSLPVEVRGAADCVNREVVRPTGRDAKALVRLARDILSGRRAGQSKPLQTPEICLTLIRKLIAA
jgi:hypothetical protein